MTDHCALTTLLNTCNRLLQTALAAITPGSAARLTMGAYRSTYDEFGQAQFRQCVPSRCPVG